MPRTINENSSFDENIQTPVRGDKEYASTIDDTFQKLTNRTKWLKDSSINGLTNPDGSITLAAGDGISIEDNGTDTITITSTVSITGDFSDYVQKSGDTMTGLLEAPTLKATSGIEVDTTGLLLPEITLKVGGTILGAIRANSDGVDIKDGNNNDIIVASYNDGVTVPALAGQPDGIVTVDVNGKLQNSGASTSGFLGIGGGTLTGSLIIDGADNYLIVGSMGGENNSIVTVDDVGALQNSGIPSADILYKSGDTMTGTLNVPYLVVNENNPGPLPTVELQSGGGAVSYIRGFADGVELLDSGAGNMLTVDNTGLTVTPLYGNEYKAVTLDNNGKLVASDTLKDTGGIDSIDFYSFKALLDINGNGSLLWNARELYNTSELVMNWENRELVGDWIAMNEFTVTGLAGNTDNIVTLDENGKLQASGVTVSSLQNDIGVIENIDFFLRTGEDATFTLRQYANYAFNLNEIVCTTSTGSITANILNGISSVTNMSSISISASPSTTTTSEGNSFAIGDKLSIQFTNNTAAIDIAISIKITRT